jgi:hypothetical protein
MSRPQKAPPPISPQVAMMLAGSMPPAPPVKPLAAWGGVAFGVGIDPRLADIMSDIRMGEIAGGDEQERAFIAKQEEIFGLACNVAAKVGDAAFFSQAARISATLSNENWLRLYVWKAWRVKREKSRVADIAKWVNLWRESDGRRPVGIDTVRNELDAMGCPRERGKNSKARN